jgi:1-acyl-sn-glycerol-3-phosphate acyltransferase
MLRAFARFVLKRMGWEVDGEVPLAKNYVLITAPHTSNWDLFYMLAIAKLVNVKVRWMGKHTLFTPPLGWATRRLGGIPIYRHLRNDVVQQMVERLTSGASLILAIPPKGTRGPAEYWKSGFYHIANIARVPIVMGYLDYAKRRGGIGPALVPSGDVKADMDVIRAFYSDKVGKYPEHSDQPRLREEDGVS